MFNGDSVLIQDIRLDESHVDGELGKSLVDGVLDESLLTED